MYNPLLELSLTQLFPGTFKKKNIENIKKKLQFSL